MTNEDKLKHFETSVISRANEQSQEMLRQYQETLDKEEAAYQERQNQQALARIKAEIGHLKRECNSSLAREQLNIKQQLTKKNQELTEKLFEEAAEKLKAYMDSPEYETLLKAQIGRIQKIAGEREMEIFLSPSDEKHLERLQEAAGVKLSLAPEAFLGGTRGYVDHGRILVDYSFDSRLAELKENFTFEGGISHE